MQKEFKGLAKSIVIYGFGNVSIKLIGLVLLPLYTNTSFLSSDEYGSMGLLDISAQILVAIFSLSLSSAYLRWYWDKAYFNVRKKIFYTCFVTLSILAVFLALTGSVSAKAASRVLFNGEFHYAIAIMIVATSLQPLIDFVLTQMRAESKAGFFISTNIARLLISLLATIYLLKYQKHGLAGVYEAQLIGNIAFLLITSRYILKNIEFSFSKDILRDILKFSIPLAVASLSNVLLVVFDRYVLNFKSTRLDVALYTQGFKIANTTKVFIVSSVQLALAPAVFKIMNRPDNKIIYSKIMTWFTIIVVYFSLFMSLFGLEITKVFTTDKIYFDSYKLIPLFSLGIIFGMLKDVSVTGLQITKQTKIIGKVLIGVAVFNFACNMMLVPLWGTYGAASSSFISQFIFFIIMFFAAQKEYKIPYRLDKVLLIIVSGAAMFIAGNFFNTFSLGVRIAAKSAALLVFPVLLLLFRVIDQSEMDMALSVIDNIRKIFKQSKKEEIDQSVSELSNVSSEEQNDKI